MLKLSPLVVSVGASVVLFVGTTAGILASQGRFGELLGKKPAGAGDHTESAPAGENLDGTATQPADHNTTTDSPAPVAASMGKDTKTSGDTPSANKGGHGAENTNTKNDSSKVAKNNEKVNTSDKSNKHGGGAITTDPQRAPAKEVTIPKRGATASVVSKFTLPSPFSSQELETLLNDLNESRDQYDKLQLRVAEEKAANERDRLEIEANFEKLKEIQTKLDAEKTEVTGKVIELSKRVDALTAGEEKFIKATVNRIKDLPVDEMKVQLFDLDTRLAAQVVSRLEPKKQGKLIHSLPAEKRVLITKMLEAMLRLGEAPAAPPAAKPTQKPAEPAAGH
ncbi:MAG: hypothetical protein ACKVS6_04545 [Planctomycetota bacterium]